MNKTKVLRTTCSDVRYAYDAEVGIKESEIWLVPPNTKVHYIGTHKKVTDGGTWIQTMYNVDVVVGATLVCLRKTTYRGRSILELEEYDMEDVGLEFIPCWYPRRWQAYLPPQEWFDSEEQYLQAQELFEQDKQAILDRIWMWIQKGYIVLPLREE